MNEPPAFRPRPAHSPLPTEPGLYPAGPAKYGKPTVWLSVFRGHDDQLWYTGTANSSDYPGRDSWEYNAHVELLSKRGDKTQWYLRPGEEVK